MMSKLFFTFFILLGLLSSQGQCSLDVDENQFDFTKLGGDVTQKYFNFPDVTSDCEVTIYNNPVDWLSVSFYNVDVGGFNFNVGYNLNCQPNSGLARSATISFTNVSGASVSILVTQETGVQPSKLIFTYDLSGNQINRQFVNQPSAKQLDVTEEPIGLTQLDKLEEEAIANSIKISPNPTEGLLRLDWDSAINSQINSITVIELSGRQWKVSFDKNQSSAEIDLTNYASGMYIVQFDLEGQRLISKKIIKN